MDTKDKDVFKADSIACNSGYKDKSEAFLLSKEIPIDSSKIEKLPAEDSRKNYCVRTNLFKLNVLSPRTIYKYRLEIFGMRIDEDETSRVYDFTARNLPEVFEYERRKCGSRIFNAFVHLNEKALPSRDQFYHDQQSVLYSTIKILPSPDLKYEFSYDEAFPGLFQDTIDVMVDRAHFLNCQRFSVKFAFVGENVSADFVREFGDEIDERELEMVAFLNVATSQVMIIKPEEFFSFPNGVTYFENPLTHGYDASWPMLNGKIFIAAGLQKSTKIIESGKSFSFSIAVRPKLSLFHHGVTLEEKLQSVLPNVKLAESIVRGLYVCPLHLLHREQNPRTLISRVIGLGKPANAIVFEYNGEKITVADYFVKIHGISIFDPTLPVAICSRGSRETYYPLEVCGVWENQRVNSKALTGELIAGLISYAAALPELLQKRITACFSAMGLTNSAFLRNAGIEIESVPMEVEVPILPPPTIMYQMGMTTPFETQLSGWRTKRVGFCRPGTVGIWAIYALVRGQNFSEAELRQFTKEYMDMLKRKQIIVGSPTEAMVLNGGRPNDPGIMILRNRLEEAKKANCNFVLVITNKSDVLVHATLKAYEQEIGILTQNVTAKIAKQAAGCGNFSPKILMMENIVNKTNIKLGGLNYNISSGPTLLGDEDLFIGFALNHVGGELNELEVMVQKKKKLSRKPNAPTVLGYAANDSSSDSITFVGDYIYHPPTNQGDLSAFYQAMVKICDRYKASRRSLPKRVIIYRSGCSDGDLQCVRKYEVPVLCRVISENLGPAVDVIFMVVNKFHNISLVPSEIPQVKGSQQNIPHGVVVDYKITSPFFTEFYLAGHRALQGTTKAPRYVLIYSKQKMSLSEIEKITYDLCFAYQIISAPVSLPAPLYIAEQYAKRGRVVYNAHVNKERIDVLPRDEGNAYDFKEMTRVLSYDECELRVKRFNA